MNEVLSQSELLQQYIATLEKTNQQLGLWSNPYGVSIMIVSAWVTIIAICVAYAIYRQGADYKNKLAEDRENNNKKFNDFLEEQKTIVEKQTVAIEKQTKLLEKRQQRIEEIDKQIEDKIAEAKQQLVSAGKAEKDKLEKKIKSLSSERLQLYSTNPVAAFGFDDNVLSSWKAGRLMNQPLSIYHLCTACGYGFMVTKDDPLSTSSIISFSASQAVRCPKCGNVDKI